MSKHLLNNKLLLAVKLSFIADDFLFAFFLVFNVFIGAAVVAKLKFQHVHFFPSLDLIFVNGASNSLGTFVLFWTLFYNICHLF